MTHPSHRWFVVVVLVLTGAVTFAQTVSISPVFSTTTTPEDADDPAIWIHPTDPSRSVIVGVDKFEGVYVWNMNGELIQHLPQGSASRVNNIDVRYDFQLGGRSVDVVATNLRDAGKLAFFTINPDYTQDDVLTQIAGLESIGNDITDGSYGLTLYRRPSDGALYLIDLGDGDEVWQYRIEDDGSGSGIVVTPVRMLDYSGGLGEGFVADDATGFLYLGEEDVAMYKYLADPDLGVDGAIATFATGDGIEGDREGAALYLCGDGSGYLLLSSQGNSTIKVYERQGDNRFVKTIEALRHDGSGGLSTDGLDVTSAPIQGSLPAGFLVVHDGGENRYHVYDWLDVAGVDLQLCPETDRDGDGIGDGSDSCPFDFDPGQEDSDGDGAGDACDNCLFDRNPTQSDTDGDLDGDHCDLDDGMIYVLFHQPERVEWQEEMGFSSWNSYRGDVGVLEATGVYTQLPRSNPNAAKTCDILDTWLLEGDPLPGTAAFYLTTGNGVGGESSLGVDGDGVERVNSDPCP